MNCKRFFEIVTEGNERYYFPMLQIKRLWIVKKTVHVVIHDEQCTEERRHEIDNVSNIEQIVREMNNFGL